MTAKSMGTRHVSTSGIWEQQINTSAWPKSPNGMKPSRSDPALAPPFSAAPGSIIVKSFLLDQIAHQET